MGELELVGLHEDGEHLVLVAPDGARFRVRIDEPLRAAVRRDRPQLEQLRAESAGTLSPREIQARIRAGATTQEVADSAGLPVERVRRYEGPVLAEREHVAELARGTRVGRDVGAPTLGDLVTDRLAARGVDPASLAVGRRARRVGTVDGPGAVRGRRRRARGPLDLRPGQAHRRRRRGRGSLALGDRAARRARLTPSPRCGARRGLRLPGRRRPAPARRTSLPTSPNLRPTRRRRPRPCWTTCAAAAVSGRTWSSTTTPRSSRASGRSTRSTSDGLTHPYPAPIPPTPTTRPRPRSTRRPSPFPNRSPPRRPSTRTGERPRAARRGRAKVPELGRDRLRRET